MPSGFSLAKVKPLPLLHTSEILDGCQPIQMRLEYTLVKYWYHVCNLPQDRLPKKTFIWAEKIADVGKKNWLFQVRLLLFFINAGNRKETLARIWDSLVFFLHKWENGVWDMGSESGG